MNPKSPTAVPEKMLESLSLNDPMRPLQQEARRMLAEKKDQDQRDALRAGDKEDERWLAKHELAKVEAAKRQSFLEAAWQGNVNALKKHLKGRNRLHVDVADAEGTGMTALHLASNKKQREVIEFLLENHASVNLTNSWGWTPLLFAANNEDLQSVKLLVAASADADKAPQGGRYDGMTAMWRCLDKGFFDIAEYLFSIDCRVNPAMEKLHVDYIKEKFGNKFDSEKNKDDPEENANSRKAQRVLKERQKMVAKLIDAQKVKDLMKKTGGTVPPKKELPPLED